MSWHQSTASQWQQKIPPQWMVVAETYDHGTHGKHDVVILTDPTGWGHWRVQRMARPEHPARPYVGDVWVDEHPHNIYHDRLCYPTPDACLDDGLDRLPSIVKAMHPHQRHDQVTVTLTADQTTAIVPAVKIAETWYGPATNKRCHTYGCEHDGCRAFAWRRIGTTIDRQRATNDGVDLVLEYGAWLETCDGLDAARDWTREAMYECHSTNKQQRRCRRCRQRRRHMREWAEVEHHLRTHLQGSPPKITPPVF